MASSRGAHASRSRVGRASWRGRRPPSQPWERNGTSSASEPPVPFELGASIDNIDIKTIFIEEAAPTISDVKYVASYNWLDYSNPTILVPGSPPAWTPPASDITLPQDSGDVFRDVNAARYPSYPTEPAIRALLLMQENPDLKSLDIVACGSTLGKLLSFASSDSRGFRFDVDLIGNTVFFIRKESSPTELIKDIRGYGHTFPEAYTTWDADVANSCSHQRIIQYDFGGLKILLRSETDGYVRKASLTVPKPKASNETSSSDAIGSLSIAPSALSSSSANPNLIIRNFGTPIPQSRIFDLKTRSIYNPFKIDTLLPRLWANQTPNFLLAVHKSGVFDSPNMKPIKSEVQAWEKDNATVLARFHAILKRIMDVAHEEKDAGRGKMEVSWDGIGEVLKVTRQIEGRDVLPIDLREKWLKCGGSGVGSIKELAL